MGEGGVLRDLGRTRYSRRIDVDQLAVNHSRSLHVSDHIFFSFLLVSTLGSTQSRASHSVNNIAVALVKGRDGSRRRHKVHVPVPYAATCDTYT